MPYIARNAANEIIGVHESQLEGHDHWLDAEEAEVKEFLIKHRAKQSLTGSDVEMIRVVEDLIDVLMAKQIFVFTELPEAVQAKLTSRRKVREDMNSLQNLMDEDEAIF